MSGTEDPNPSRAFAKQMTAHHHGALEMAQVALQQELDPEMRALAEKIVADQTREIAQMRAYLQRTEPNR